VETYLVWFMVSVVIVMASVSIMSWAWGILRVQLMTRNKKPKYRAYTQPTRQQRMAPREMAAKGEEKC
jgi:hypothetical protein